MQTYRHIEHQSASASAERQRLASALKARDTQIGILERELAALESHIETGKESAPAKIFLPQRFLYVGGRPGCFSQIRACIDSSGGALLVHDGGTHDHTSLVAGLISQADQVIFPVDCVSHEAALMVKRLCRKMRKLWLPLRSSSLSSFLTATG